MKTFLSTLLALGLFFSTIGFTEELTGRRIMERQKQLHEFETEYAEEVMLLVDGKSGAKEKREIQRHAKKMGNGFNRHLIVFIAPVDIKGTALLTHELKKEDNQWMYMPALKKMQRIAKAGKKSYFMGTDFTYEDMEPEDIDNYKYKKLRTETVDHLKPARHCHVIESLPANQKKKRISGYSKRILWIDNETYITLKVEYYDRRNRLIKTQKSFEIQKIEGTVYRPRKIVMDNHKKQHKTLILAKERELNQTISDQVFTERFIISEKHCD